MKKVVINGVEYEVIRNDQDCLDTAILEEKLTDYFDSYDYQSIYHALEEIVNNRESWVDKIVKQKDLTMFNAQFAMKRFNDILKEAIIIRENWG